MKPTTNADEVSSADAKRAMPAMPSEVSRCTSCVLPRTTRGLCFGPDGRCMLCAKAGRLFRTGDGADGAQGLDDVIRVIRERGKGRRYDCVVGFSGGRDSSYMLYELVHKHRLRVLAAYYRTPFTPDVIDSNVHRIVKLLEINLVPLRLSAEYHLRVAKRFLLLWRKHPIPAIANLVCAPCKLVTRELYRTAREHGVGSIVWGGSRYEDFQFGAAQVPGRADEDSFATQALKVAKVIRKGTALLLHCPSVVADVPLAIRASVLYLAPHSVYLRLRYPRIYRVNYFRFAEWSERECARVLSLLGWELPPGCHSSWKADCEMAEAKNLMFLRMMGLTYTDALFANMVRAGAMTRDEAINRVATEGSVSRTRLGNLAARLGLPAGAFE